jgi:hypothetical protein
MNDMILPIELTEFVPEKIDFGMFRSWELKANDFDDTVEIRSNIFSRQMKVVAVVSAAWMLFIFGIIATILFMNDIPLQDGIDQHVLKWFLIAFAGLACLALTVVLNAIFIYTTYSNASLWKDKLRFRYTKSTGELFFPRENVRYSRSGYNEFLLGTTDGYDTVRAMEHQEMSQKPSRAPFATETYFLVHRKDGTWTRHLVGFDQRMKATRLAVAKIKEALQCRTVKRTMSRQECYATQHKNVGVGVATQKPLNPQGLFALYAFLSFFALVGLGIIGIGLNGLWHADDNAVKTIIFGTVFFLFPLILMFLVRCFSITHIPAGSYTPSEPVFD